MAEVEPFKTGISYDWRNLQQCDKGVETKSEKALRVKSDLNLPFRFPLRSFLKTVKK